MARAARYGNIQPSEFEGMEYMAAIELTERVTNMHLEDTKLHLEFDIERTNATIKAIGAAAGAQFAV